MSLNITKFPYLDYAANRGPIYLRSFSCTVVVRTVQCSTCLSCNHITVSGFYKGSITFLFTHHKKIIPYQQSSQNPQLQDTLDSSTHCVVNNQGSWPNTGVGISMHSLWYSIRHYVLSYHTTTLSSADQFKFLYSCNISKRLLF